MPDSLKNDLVTVEYVAGEQPTHTKLTQSITQLKTSIERMNKAIGDLYSEQTHTGSSGSYDIDYLPSVGPNLSRFIGSVGWLNPRRFSRTLQTLTVTFGGHGNIDSVPPNIKTFDHYNRREFKLPFPPIYFTSDEGAENVTFLKSTGLASWAIGSPSAVYTDVSLTKLANRKTYLSAVNSAGEYHVGSDGVITTFDPIDDPNPGKPEGFTVTYEFHMIPDRYDGASQNVIPDFSQTTNLCNVTLVSGSIYQVVLPTFDSRRAWSDLTDWDPTRPETTTFDAPRSGDGLDPQDGNQLLLPFALRNNLSNGDIIPDGYIYLWNETTNEIITGVTFNYVNTYTVNCTGVALTVGTATYRVIVPGTTIGQTISYLAESYQVHDHSGLYSNIEGVWQGERIHHYDLLNSTDEGSENMSGFVVSEAGPTRNPHPQYLHRYGYQFGADAITDAGNVGNAMLGDLVLTDTTGVESLNPDSYRIYFGDYAAGPSVHWDIGINAVRFREKDVAIDEELWADKGLGTAKTTSFLKWNSIQHTITVGEAGVNLCEITVPVPGIGGDQNSEEYVVSITGTGYDVGGGANAYVIGAIDVVTSTWHLYVSSYIVTASEAIIQVVIGASWDTNDLINLVVQYLP